MYPTQYRVKCIKKSVAGINKSLRYYLRIDFQNNKTDCMTWIMMNPSTADEENYDETIKDIFEFAEKQMIVLNTERKISSVGKICVLNLFPIYQSKSNELYNDLSRVMNPETILREIRFNNRVISRAIWSSKYIVLAWGDPPHKMNHFLYYSQVQKIMKMIMEKGKDRIYVIQTKKYKMTLTERGSPRHPGRKAGIIGLKKCMIGDFEEVKVLKKLKQHNELNNVH